MKNLIYYIAVNVLGEFTIDRPKSKGIQLLHNDDLNITNAQAT